MLYILAISLGFAGLGIILGYSSIRLRVEGNLLVEEIDALLPQTQCGQCDFPGCRPYAEAIASGVADIYRCPPGGESCVKALGALLGIDVRLPNDESFDARGKELAVIDEQKCIGCALCIHACPVDAIIGASKFMHTVISGRCTGCGLCLPPCPVDCISLEVTPKSLADWRWPVPCEIGK